MLLLTLLFAIWSWEASSGAQVALPADESDESQVSAMEGGTPPPPRP